MKKIIVSSLILGISFSGLSQQKNTTLPKQQALKNGSGVVLPLDRSVRPNPGAAPTINIKDSEVFTLGNGITVILSENHKLPKVTMNLVMGSDPRNEGDKAGISEIAGQLLLSGTKNRTKDQLDAEIDYMGAFIDGRSNSITLSCLKKHLPKAIELYADVVLNANFPQSEFERIVKQQESALLSAKSSPDQIADNVEKKVNFKGHPYGEIMTEKTLANIKREDVLAYYKNTFTPTGSYLVVVGDITKDEAMKLANLHFGSWTGAPKFDANLSEGVFNSSNRVIFVKKPGAVQSAITVTFPIKMQPGHPDQLPLTVLNGILGGGSFAARFTQNLREDKAYTYGCYSSVNITDNGSWFATSGNFRNEVTDSAITQILFELNRIRKEEVTDNELSLIKSATAGSFARSLESPNTVARFALNIIQNNLPKDYYQTYLKRLEAVDKAAVLRMAQNYLTTLGCNIIVVGNEDVLEKLKVFDADGKIEQLDAFGDEASSMKMATISKDDLLEKYIMAITKTTDLKAAGKKIAKIKSVKQEMELTNANFPGTLLMTNYFVAPNKEAMKMEMQGMLLQKTYFDGTKGETMSMQAGKKEMTAQELEAKKKSPGVFPEFYYKTSGMNYELMGIETVNNKDYYVLKTNDGKGEKFDYFDVTTFLKSQSVQIEADQNSLTVYEDYKEVNGILFPHALSLSIGEMNLKGVSKSFEANGKVDAKVFE
jgi:zinc protease